MQTGTDCITTILLCHVVMMFSQNDLSSWKFWLYFYFLVFCFSCSQRTVSGVDLLFGDWTYPSNVFMFLLAAATTRSHQQGQQRPANLSRQEFLERKVTVHISSWSPAPTSIYCLADFYGCCRFKRSAGLVASGVAKNLNKTAHYIKENIQDILYPDRRPPK